MLGWMSWRESFSSCLKRATRTSEDCATSNTLSATLSSSSRSKARNTDAIPPCPIFASSRYRPAIVLPTSNFSSGRSSTTSASASASFLVATAPAATGPVTRFTSSGPLRSTVEESPPGRSGSSPRSGSEGVRFLCRSELESTCRATIAEGRSCSSSRASRSVAPAYDGCTARTFCSASRAFSGKPFAS